MTTTTRKNRKSILGAAARAAIEPLEDRTLMTVNLASATNIGTLPGITAPALSGNTLYKFSIPLNDSLYASASPSGSITILDKNGNTLKPGTGSLTTTLTAGTFYAEDASAATKLTLLSEVAGTGLGNAESMGQLDNTTKTFADYVGPTNGYVNNYYAFRLASTNNISFSLTSGSGITLKLLDVNGNTLQTSASGSLSNAALGAGHYYLELSQTTAATNTNYILKSVATTSAPVLTTNVSVSNVASTLSDTNGAPVTFTLTVSNTGNSAATNVLLLDTFPTSDLLAGHSSTGAGSVSTGSGTYSDAFTSLAAGATVTDTIVVAPSANETLVDTASVSSLPTTGNNTAQQTVTVTGIGTVGTPVVALSAPAVVSPSGTVSTGTPVTFTYTLSNTGTASASNVQVIDTWSPTGTVVPDAFASTPSAGVTETLGIGSATFAVASLGVGASDVLTVTLTPTANGTLTDTAVLTGGNTSSGSVTVGTTPPPGNGADVGISLVGAPTAAAGSTVTWTLAVTDNGPLAVVGNTTVTEPIPNTTGLTILTETVTGPAAGSAGYPGNIVANITNLAAGATDDVIVTATVPATTGTITTTASLNSPNDPITTNNVVSVPVTVTTPVVTTTTVALTETATSPVTVTGTSTPITYTVNVTNTGSVATTGGVTLSDTLPAGTTFVSATATTGTPTQAGGVVTLNVGNLNATVGDQVVIVVDAPGTGTYVNAASVSAGTNYAAPAPANASVIVSTAPSSALTIGITGTPNPVVGLNASATYTVTVTNTGATNATGIVVTDVLPSTTTFVSDSVSTTPQSSDGHTLTVALANLLPSASESFTLVVQPTAVGNITDTATVNPGGATTTDTLNVNGGPNAVTIPYTGPNGLSTTVSPTTPVGSGNSPSIEQGINNFFDNYSSTFDFSIPSTDTDRLSVNLTGGSTIINNNTGYNYLSAQSTLFLYDLTNDPSATHPIAESNAANIGGTPSDQSFSNIPLTAGHSYQITVSSVATTAFTLEAQALINATNTTPVNLFTPLTPTTFTGTITQADPLDEFTFTVAGTQQYLRAIIGNPTNPFNLASVFTSQASTTAAGFQHADPTGVGIQLMTAAGSLVPFPASFPGSNFPLLSAGADTSIYNLPLPAGQYILKVEGALAPGVTVQDYELEVNTSNSPLGAAEPIFATHTTSPGPTGAADVVGILNNNPPAETVGGTYFLDNFTGTQNGVYPYATSNPTLLNVNNNIYGEVESPSLVFNNLNGASGGTQTNDPTNYYEFATSKQEPFTATLTYRFPFGGGTTAADNAAVNIFLLDSNGNQVFAGNGKSIPDSSDFSLSSNQMGTLTFTDYDLPAGTYYLEVATAVDTQNTQSNMVATTAVQAYYDLQLTTAPLPNTIATALNAGSTWDSAISGTNTADVAPLTSYQSGPVMENSSVIQDSTLIPTGQDSNKVYQFTLAPAVGTTAPDTGVTQYIRVDMSYTGGVNAIESFGFTPTFTPDTGSGTFTIKTTAGTQPVLTTGPITYVPGNITALLANINAALKTTYGTNADGSNQIFATDPSGLYGKILLTYTGAYGDAAVTTAVVTPTLTNVTVVAPSVVAAGVAQAALPDPLTPGANYPSGSLTLSLYNQAGQLLDQQANVPTNSTTIWDVPGAYNGVYYVEVSETGTGTVANAFNLKVSSFSSGLVAQGTPSPASYIDPAEPSRILPPPAAGSYYVNGFSSNGAGTDLDAALTAAPNNTLTPITNTLTAFDDQDIYAFHVGDSALADTNNAWSLNFTLTNENSNAELMIIDENVKLADGSANPAFGKVIAYSPVTAGNAVVNQSLTTTLDQGNYELVVAQVDNLTAPPATTPTSANPFATTVGQTNTYTLGVTGHAQTTGAAGPYNDTTSATARPIGAILPPVSVVPSVNTGSGNGSYAPSNFVNPLSSSRSFAEAAPGAGGDWYTFTVATAEEVTISFPNNAAVVPTPPATNANDAANFVASLYLNTSPLTLVTKTSENFPANTTNSVTTTLQPGTYFINVTNPGAAAPYVLNISTTAITPAVENASPGLPLGTLQQAVLPANPASETIVGAIAAPTNNWYQFSLPTTGSYTTLTATPATTGFVTLTLYSSAAPTTPLATSVGGGTLTYAVTPGTAGNPNLYFLKVSPLAAGTDPYTVTLVLT